MGAMMLMMPLMSLWFTFMVPGGAGLYWTIDGRVHVTAGGDGLLDQSSYTSYFKSSSVTST